MKLKPIIVFSLFLAAAMVSFCGKPESEASQVVKKVLLSQNADKFQEIKSCFQFSGEEAQDAEREEELKMIWREMTQDFQIKKVVVLNEKYQGDEGNVLVKLTYTNGIEKDDNILMVRKDGHWRILID